MLLNRKPGKASINRAKPLLGTFVHLALFSDELSEDALLDLSSACFARIAQIQKLMSFFDPHSEISLINSTVPNNPVTISPETSEVLRLANTLYIDSGGAFDPMQRDRSLYPEARIYFHGDNCLSRSLPAAIDLGGIAKGFAVDQAVKTFRATPEVSGVVNAGGDMFFFGRQPLPFVIRSPYQDTSSDLPRYLKGETVYETAVATSVFGPESAPTSITIIAKSCVVADALTKIVYGADHETAKSILNRYQAREITIGATRDVNHN